MDMYIPLLRALWEIKYVFLFFFLLYLLPRVILIYRRHKEDKRLKECGIEEIDRFSGETFERYLRVIFQSKGYTVKMTKKKPRLRSRSYHFEKRRNHCGTSKTISQ